MDGEKNKIFRTVLQVLFFPAAILYGELLLKAFDRDGVFVSMALLRIALFSIAMGFVLFLILDLIPWSKVSRVLSIIILTLGIVYICIERGCKSFFKVYFSFGYMGGMTGQVVGDFGGTILEIMVSMIPFILLSLIPVVVFVIFRKKFFEQREKKWKAWLGAFILFVVFQVAGSWMSYASDVSNVYTYDFSANSAVPEFGAITSLRLELQYQILGKPEAPLADLGDILDEEKNIKVPSLEPEEGVGEEVEEEIVYGYNEMDIDFKTLISSEKDQTLLSMHNYFSSITPTQKNEYTGYFEGKNLIMITAEAFSPYVISEKFTPTLYKLANESFVFNNYYQPNWTQSTAGGEFAVLTGLIPTWVDNSMALTASAKVSMPTTLGWQFQSLGYSSLAYHNNSYTYYGRDKTHPNMGYNYKGIGNGLELQSNVWPNSDLEMMQATVPGYIQDYLQNGTKFHAYYMTVSGHANYTWTGNNMAKKNRVIAEAAYPQYSDQVQGYLACNWELEYAMTYLMEELEKAGIADDTVIVLTADHYPYGLKRDGVDYYVELSGVEDSEKDTSRYRNTLIMWCGSMEETVVVDTPCSSIDIVPTLCNLFGIEYDSRLYSGRDIFATNYEATKASTSMPLVVFMGTGGGYSWVTEAGTYEASSGTFIPKDGVVVDDDYVKTVKQLVQAKFSYAKLILQKDYYSKVLPSQ